MSGIKVSIHRIEFTVAVEHKDQLYTRHCTLESEHDLTDADVDKAAQETIDQLVEDINNGRKG